MSPRTRLFSVVAGSLLLTACGSPPAALPAGPARPHVSIDLPSSGVVPPPAYPTYPSGPVYPTSTYPTSTYPVGTYPTGTYVVPTRTTTGTVPPATSPTPTPSRAAPCAGQPTGAEILAEVKESDAVPSGTLTVSGGPYCSGAWSFTTIGKSGAEPLSVVTTGAGDTLTIVTLGTDVCNPQVQAQAPAAIRVFACGF
ncbi:hypothetical protein [Actinoplanes couchii]|uniref:Lipoprotein n=1 Tax=Actinoplanes couchii TaxID=403638 RepID=A0ABQ3XJ88_9ACTN|nr:hypothetical protein [Actinoplanes couchii]MDR6324441.1 hypothetical protein [Actinoplanes couchii]GID58557.1 hypothetical protein Aco03nite_069610 [Actinoplanes couchii]